MKRVALVTGGTKGIGAAIVEKLNVEGYKVIATYNTSFPESPLENVVYKNLDVTDDAACQKLVSELCEKGLEPEVLVNNAGITNDAMFHKMSKENWLNVINVNLVSLYNLTHPVYNCMRSKGFGRIINISSVNANKGQIGQTNYCASKAGIQGFTKALAQEAARYGITVNTISPGYTSTGMLESIRPEILDKIIQSIPIGRLCKADEVAELVLHLVSESAGYITGTNIEINGGMYSS